jgi:hypothetical protein
VDACSCSGSIECIDTVIIRNINDNDYLGHRTDYCCVSECELYVWLTVHR